MKPGFLKTERKESWSTWRFRQMMNWYPMYFGTGGKITFWAADHRELHLKLRLNIWSYNIVGTIFGGSMFSAADPFYMILFMNCLGREKYVVWDKSASIRFRKPARKTLFAKYLITEEQLEKVKAEIAQNGETELICKIEWLDSEGILYAESERLVYLADKKYYEEKKGFKQKTRFS
jgi:hypothetical protein